MPSPQAGGSTQPGSIPGQLQVEGFSQVPLGGGSGSLDLTQFGGPQNFEDFTQLVFTLLGVIALFTSIAAGMIGGFLMISSFGDEGRYGSGRSLLFASLVGITLVVLSYAIVQLIISVARNLPG